MNPKEKTDPKEIVPEDNILEETETEQAKTSIKQVHLKMELLGDANVETRKLCITIQEPLVGSMVPRLVTPLLTAVLSADWPVVLDLRTVSEIDSDGLSLLLKLHKTMPVEIRPLSLLVTPGTQPARIISLSGLERIMTVLTDLEYQ